MVKMILNRFLQMIPTLLIVITIIFVITRLIPSDPASIMLGPQASQEDIMELNEELGLNEPIYVQYVDYIVDILHGDFGDSYYYKEPSLSLIIDRFPITLTLAAAALVLALIIGIPLGILSARKQNTAIDYFAMTITLLGVSMPIFWLGLMLVSFFSVRLEWLPSYGLGDMEDGLWDYISHLILPVICLTTIPMANIARITRTSFIETFQQDFIKSLRAKGISMNKIIYKHAFKNALPPIITVVGLQLSSLLAGAILTETVFAIPGIGRLIVDAINNRDYALIQSCVLFVAFIYVTVNLFVDIVYMYVNPKISYSGTGGDK